MKELVFEVRFYLARKDITHVREYRGLASTPEEASSLLESLFKPRVIKGNSGVYLLAKPLEVQVIDGQGLIE
jgi:hypothetical protein